MFEASMLSRLQFAFTAGYHIIFPSITIGLAVFLLIVEVMWLKTKDKAYVSIYQFFAKFFGLCFAMGVVTGIPMAFQFGTNWAKFSQFAAPALGPLLAAEVLSAFFLEAIFIGIMLFGWRKVPPLVHLFSTFCVALGTHNSAFWILVVNSWMQTPSGVELIDGVIHITSWKDVIFNPSMPYRLAHMLNAAYITGAMLVCGVMSYHILKNNQVALAQKGLSVALVILAITATSQVIIGDLHGLNTFKHQPAKLAAMEGKWETEKDGASFIVFAIPNEKEAKNEYEIVIPKALSLLLTKRLDGEVRGLKEWAPEYRPNVWMPFFGLRVMIGLGLIYLFLGLFHFYLKAKGRLYTTKWFLRMNVLFAATPLLAVVAGWVITEIGRQPWLVYNLLLIKGSVSPGISAASVSFTLVAIVALYVLILVPFLYYGFRFLRENLAGIEAIEVYEKTKR